MRRLAGTSLLLLAFLALPALDLYAQKDKKNKFDIKDKPTIDSAALKGEFVGKLKSVPGTDRIFLIEAESKRLVSTGNPGQANNNVTRILQLQNRITQDQRQMSTAKSPQQRNQAAQRLQNDQVQLQRSINQLSGAGNGGIPAGYRVETTKTDIEFQASEVVKVRSLVLPDGGFDDKGNVRKMSKEDIAKLRGKDKDLPGYESSLDKLEVGQTVRVVLTPAPKKKDVDKEEEAADKKMQVKLIVVLEESKGSFAPPPKPKKKK